VNPTKYIGSILSGTSLFYNSVMPSLLPFFFVSKIIFGLGTLDKMINFFRKPICKIFKVPPVTSYVLIMSILCGYPVGAKIIGELEKTSIINKEDAKKMIAICSTSGPIFVIGSVGGALFNSVKLGVSIFICHIVGCILAGLILSIKFPKLNAYSDRFKSERCENLLTQSTTSTITSILTVAIYVSIFYMFIDMAYDLKILGFFSNNLEKVFNMINIDNSFAKGISSGLVEMTRGLAEIASSSNNQLKLIFSSCLISFGGFSIFIQTLTFLNECKIKALYLLKIKCLQTILSGLVAYGVSLIIF
jgi:sporulation integral membrane protein YlbJ